MKNNSKDVVPSMEQLQSIHTMIEETYFNNLLKLPSRREHKNIVLEQEVKKQLKRYSINKNNNINDVGSRLLSKNHGIESLTAFQHKLLEELVRRCFKDSTTNEELLYAFNENEVQNVEQKPEEKNDEQYNNRNKLQGQRVEIENAGGQIANKIRKKAFRQPIVGGSAKAYASAMKKMKNEKKNTTTTTTLQQKQQQQKKKINPKSDNLSTMILPIATSYFNLRDQIFKLKDVINKKDIELKKTNSKCTQLENDAKILRDVLSDTNSKRQHKLVSNVANKWKSLLNHDKGKKYDDANNNKDDENTNLEMQDLQLKLSNKSKELINMKMNFESLKKQNNKLLIQLKQEKQKRKKQEEKTLPPAPTVSPRPNIVTINNINEAKLKDEIKILKDTNQQQGTKMDQLTVTISHLKKQLLSEETKNKKTSINSEDDNNNNNNNEQLNILKMKLKVATTKYDDLKQNKNEEIKILKENSQKMKIKYKQIDTKLSDAIAKYEQIISKDMKKVLILTSEKEKYKSEFLRLKNKIVVDEKDMVMELSRSKAKVSLLEKQVENLKIELLESKTQHSRCKTKLLEITTKKENAEASIEEKNYKEEHHQLEIQKIQKANKAEVIIISNKLKSFEKKAEANERRLKQEIKRQKEAYLQHEENVFKLKDELEAANLCLDVRRKERDKEKLEWDKKRIELKRKVKELELNIEQEQNRFIHLMHEMNKLQMEKKQNANNHTKHTSGDGNGGGGNFFQSAKESNRKAAQENETFQAVLKEELEIMRDAFQHKLDVKETEKQDLLKRINKLLSERNPTTGLYDNDMQTMENNSNNKYKNSKQNIKLMKTGHKGGVFQEKSTANIDMHLMLSAMDKKVKVLEEDNKKLVEKHRSHNNLL